MARFTLARLDAFTRVVDVGTPARITSCNNFAVPSRAERPRVDRRVRSR